MDPNTQKQQITSLQLEFQTIDTDHKGYITSQQFINHFKHKPHPPSLNNTNLLFMSVPNGHLSRDQFVTFMLAHRINMEQMAIAKFNISKSIHKYSDASPGGGANEIKQSYVKFKVLANKDEEGPTTEKKHIKFSIGCDQQTQNQKLALMNQLLDRDCSKIYLLIKFEMQEKADEMASLLTEILSNLQAMAGEMAPDLNELIQSVNIQCAADGSTVHIIVEINDLFFEDMAQFLKEITNILNPDAHIVFQILLQSAFLKKILKEGSQNQLEDLQVKFGLNADYQSITKLKEIYRTMMANKQLYLAEHEKLVALCATLINEVKFEANFCHSQKVLNETGMMNEIGMMKERLVFLKEMQITETASGFIPEFETFFSLLKEHGKGEGEISLNINNCFAALNFNLQVEGLLDLI